MSPTGDRPWIRVARRALLPVALMTLIAAGSLRPLPVGLPGGSDKLAHASAWAVLAWSWCRAFAVLGTPGPRVAAASIALAGAWGGCDELIQAGVPWRDADALDLLADLAGSLGGGFAWLWYRRLRSAGAGSLSGWPGGS